jgi:hypothetical protein
MANATWVWDELFSGAALATLFATAAACHSVCYLFCHVSSEIRGVGKQSTTQGTHLSISTRRSSPTSNSKGGDISALHFSKTNGWDAVGKMTLKNANFHFAPGL